MSDYVRKQLINTRAIQEQNISAAQKVISANLSMNDKKLAEIADCERKITEINAALAKLDEAPQEKQ